MRDNLILSSIVSFFGRLLLQVLSYVKNNLTPVIRLYHGPMGSHDTISHGNVVEKLALLMGLDFLAYDIFRMIGIKPAAKVVSLPIAGRSME